MQNGQINLDCEFGQELKRLAKNCKTVVEIGTWNGMGSTNCILSGMNINTNFISVELIKEMYDQAVKNLSGRPVKLLNGTIITHEDINWFDAEHHKKNCLPIELEHFELYYQKEIEALKAAKNVLHELPESIDLLILDGGEYSTYPEWQLLKDRVSIVALDDTNLLKTKKIKQELIKSDNWITHWESFERNGCSIFFRSTRRINEYSRNN
jgi:hypothetical protein